MSNAIGEIEVQVHRKKFIETLANENLGEEIVSGIFKFHETELKGQAKSHSTS